MMTKDKLKKGKAQSVVGLKERLAHVIKTFNGRFDDYLIYPTIRKFFLQNLRFELVKDDAL